MSTLRIAVRRWLPNRAWKGGTVRRRSGTASFRNWGRAMWIFRQCYSSCGRCPMTIGLSSSKMYCRGWGRLKKVPNATAIICGVLGCEVLGVYCGLFDCLIVLTENARNKLLFDCFDYSMHFFWWLFLV